MNWLTKILVAAGVAVSLFTASAARAQSDLIISSYEPTVELYKALNPAFEKWYKGKTGKDIDAKTDHGPSGKQSRDIASGKETDIAALSVDFDIDNIAKAGLLDKEWRKRAPNGAVPYYSAVVFMVRKGNPKGIKDWADLAREDVVGLAPDPKTGGGARWIYLSAWAHALRVNKDKSAEEQEKAALEFVGKVYDKAVLDPAMRGSTTRFIQQKTGDVLFGWENEILNVINTPAVKGQFELVVPSDSITIEVPISYVDKVTEKRGTTEAAKLFIEFLYSDEGQAIVAQFYNRPSSQAIADKNKDRFAPLNLFKFSDHFTNWPEVMKKHFLDGGTLDQIRKK